MSGQHPQMGCCPFSSLGSAGVERVALIDAVSVLEFTRYYDLETTSPTTSTEGLPAGLTARF